jgi:uncharacterized protein (TIGR01370 family)
VIRLALALALTVVLALGGAWGSDALQRAAGETPATDRGSAASAAGTGSPLDEVESFAFAIGGKGLAGNVQKRFGAYDLVVADGEESKAKKIAALRARGKIVLGYLSVGTIENWRGWYPKAKRFRLDKEPDWRGEWYADTAAPGFRNLIVDQVAPSFLAKGFDGIFLDNTDMIETHRAQRDGMYALVGGLRALLDQPAARSAVEQSAPAGASGSNGTPGRYLFAQNGDSTVGPMLSDLDGWNREDVTHTYDFDRDRYAAVPRAEWQAAKRALREIRAAGKLTTSTDYTRNGQGRWVSRAIRSACRVGAVPFVSNIELSRVPRRAARC